MDILREHNQRRWFRNKWLLALPIVLLVAFFLLINPSRPTVERERLLLGEAVKMPFTIELKATGVLEAEQQRWLNAEVGGEVIDVRLQPGKPVEADTIILVLKNNELQDQLRHAETQWRVAEADRSVKVMTLKSQLLDIQGRLSEIKSNLKMAQLQANAEQELSSKGIVSKLQQAQSQARAEQLSERLQIEQNREKDFSETVDAQLNAEKAKILALQNNYLHKKQLVEGLTVRAGLDGLLQRIAVEVGRRVQAGSELALVAKPLPLRAKLKVPQSQIGGVQIGMKAMIDLRPQRINGEVTAIAPSVEDGSVAVWVTMTEALPAQARPAMIIDGSILLQYLDSALTIERPATISQAGEFALFRLSPLGDVADRVNVRIGRVSTERVEVLAGLKVGDRVLVSDTSAWRAFSQIGVE